MKSKKWIIFVVVLNLFATSAIIQGVESHKPKTNAVGDYTLGFEIDDYFEFVCTELDTTELNSVFGGDWASDVGNYMWWCGYVAPSAVGEKAKFEIVNITYHPTEVDWWQFTYDGWGWIDKILTFGSTPDRDDYSYSLPMDPQGEMWNPSVWIMARPIDTFISALTFSGGYSYHDNIINYTGTDIGNYEVNWIYDENTGVVKQFVIKNDADTIIFELWGFELKIEIYETYNWVVTNLNAVELENVFGVNWNSDLNTFCWWVYNTPTAAGNKSKIEIDNILNHPTADWYRFYVDGWNWKDEELLHGPIPDRDDTWYNIPMDPTGNIFNPSVWLIPTPVVTFIEELSYSAGYSPSGNTITLSDTDVTSFYATWRYDVNLGVTDLFQIKNSVGTTIFRVILQEFRFPAGPEFEWEVTKLNTVELQNVLGGNWESDIESLVPHGPGCNQVGDIMKRIVNDITLSGTLWYVNYDWWYWTTTDYSVEPDMDDYPLGLYCDPEDGNWGNWMWCVPYPAYHYLVGRSYSLGTELSGLTVTQNGTDIEDYQLKFIYDEMLCVYNTVQLLNDESIVIFEYQLISSPIITNVNATNADGTYGIGNEIYITITFSEAVYVAGIPQLTLETGTNDAVVDYTSGDGTDTLTFTYTVASGHSSSDLDYISINALSLNGGTIKDAARLDAVLTLAAPGASGSLSANKDIEIDTTIENGPGPGPGPDLTTLIIIGGIVAAVGVAVILTVILLRRRKRE